MELRMLLSLFLILFLTGLVVQSFLVWPFYPSVIPISEVPDFLIHCVISIWPFVFVLSIILAVVASEAR